MKFSLPTSIAFFAIVVFCATCVSCERAVEDPSARPESPSRPDGLGITLDELLEPEGAGFSLLKFNGKAIQKEPLKILSRDGDSLTVEPAGGGLPQFTFEIDEAPDYFLLRLVKAVGDFSERNTSVIFESSGQKLEAFPLDYMTAKPSKDKDLGLVWPYLWNTNTKDPMGAFAVIKSGSPSARDESLAAIWAEGTMPHPDTGKPWTKEAVKQWVADYHKKFAGLSETTLSASNPEELNRLSEWVARTGVRRVYLHTDTWREEYWPKHRSFVSVNPKVFPGGREDLVKYGEFLKEKGIQLRLHNVSAGIGLNDPEFVAIETTEPRLEHWVAGHLEKSIGKTDTEILFRPEGQVDFPHLRLPDHWNLRRFRIGNEIVQIRSVEDVDGPVWRLKRVERGYQANPAAAFEAGTEIVGLTCTYGQNYLPGANTDLLEELAGRYAALINEAKLDHQHYDGAEIHCGLAPWGFDKLSGFVADKVNRPTTTSTSGGRPSPWNFELQFSTIQGLKELGYWPIAIPVLLDDHRNATSWLDANYEIASRLLKTARRLGFQKPEPMFGISVDELENQGMLPRLEGLQRDWQAVIGRIDDRDLSWLRRYLTDLDANSRLKQRGNHHQSFDVPVLDRRVDGDYLVPTRVMLREGLDAPWIVGQEFGPVGPRQYLQPGEKVTLTNPNSGQPPDLVLRVLPALGTVSDAALASAPATPGRSDRVALDDYATGTDSQAGSRKNETPGGEIAASLWPTPGAVEQAGDTELAFQDDHIVLKARNPTSSGVWAEEKLPSWRCKVPMLGRRGVAINLVGDGSGAVLVLQIRSRGYRDYVVKLDFTGPRRVIIPNGEAAWSNAAWGWRFDSHRIDYEGTATDVRLGFGYLPPKSDVKAVVTGIELLGNLPGQLRDPIIAVDGGSLQVKGEIQAGEYLTYNPTDGAKVFDRNWNFLRNLESQANEWIVPQGTVEVGIKNAAPDPQPWLELQLITRGEPHKLSGPQTANTNP